MKRYRMIIKRILSMYNTIAIGSCDKQGSIRSRDDNLTQFTVFSARDTDLYHRFCDGANSYI